MKTSPTKLITLLAGLVTSTLCISTNAQAQSYSKTFSRVQAQDPGISVQLCQNDMMIVVLPGVVKSVGVTLPGNVEPQFDGTRVIMRGNITTGRTPIAILMRDSDDIYRMHLSGCPTRGASTLIKIVDDSPTPVSAKEFVAPAPAAPTAPAAAAAPISSTLGSLNPVTAALTGMISLPTPSTVQTDVSRTATGLTVTVANGTAQTLSLRPENLQLTVGGQSVTVPADVGSSLAPGLSGAYTVPLPTNLMNTDVALNWLVTVPSLRAQFIVQSSLK